MTRLLMYTLALFRFTMLLYEEEGPGGLLLDFRTYLGVKEFQELTIGGSTNTVRQADNWVADMFNCPFCLSGWLAIPMALGYHKRWRLSDIIAAWGAIWAGAYFLFKFTGHDPVGEVE